MAKRAAAACALASGDDTDDVKERALSKQVGSSKNFGGHRGSARGPLDTRAQVERWVGELAEDVASRLLEEREENQRVATSLVVACVSV